MQAANDERMPLLNRVRNGGCISRELLFRIIGLVLGVIFTIIMIVVGATYMNNCPLQENVPIFLFVSGFANTILLLASFFLHLHWKKEKFYSKFAVAFEFGVMVIFNIVWNVAGSAWVFGVWTVYNSDVIDPTKQCHSAPYIFSFVLLVIYWITLPVVVVGVLI